MTASILIVDDDLTNLNLMKKIYDKANYQTIAAENGPDALKLFKENSIDLIVTDVQMPNMDGYQFIEIVRQMDFKIPIIVITAFIDKLENNRGETVYLSKPYAAEELLDITETILNITKKAVI